VNNADNKGKTPLHEASYGGHLKVVQALLAAGANVNEVDEIGHTPLWWASYKGHSDVKDTLNDALNKQ
jgi:ankyrin repeat protein